jgi:hypothetical protein
MSTLTEPEDSFRGHGAAGDGFPSMTFEQGAAQVQMDEIAADAKHAPDNTLSHLPPPRGAPIPQTTAHGGSIWKSVHTTRERLR